MGLPKMPVKKVKLEIAYSLIIGGEKKIFVPFCSVETGNTASLIH